MLDTFSPALAQPFYMASSLIDGFDGLKTALPSLKSAFGSVVPNIASMSSGLRSLVASSPATEKLFTTIAPKAAKFGGVIQTSLIGGLDRLAPKATGALGKLAPIFGRVTPLISRMGAKLLTLIPMMFSVGSAAFTALAPIIVPLLPFIAIAAAIVGAVLLIKLAFQSNFLGIRSIVEGVINGVKLLFGVITSIATFIGSILILPIQALMLAGQGVSAAINVIIAAWTGFSGFFGGLMGSIVQMGMNAGNWLIQALNHSPTVKIPLAWEGAFHKITGGFTNLVNLSSG